MGLTKRACCERQGDLYQHVATELGKGARSEFYKDMKKDARNTTLSSKVDRWASQAGKFFGDNWNRENVSLKIQPVDKWNVRNFLPKESPVEVHPCQSNKTSKSTNSSSKNSSTAGGSYGGAKAAKSAASGGGGGDADGGKFAVYQIPTDAGHFADLVQKGVPSRGCC